MFVVVGRERNTKKPSLGLGKFVKILANNGLFFQTLLGLGFLQIFNNGFDGTGRGRDIRATGMDLLFGHIQDFIGLAQDRRELFHGIDRIALHANKIVQGEADRNGDQTRANGKRNV